MSLTKFLLQLSETGRVKVGSQITPIQAQDLQEAAKVLQVWHQKDALEMPLIPPAFEKVAALWAAEYLYRAIQLIMLRDLGEEAVIKHLGEFPYQLSPSVIYSVDLCFRYLPDVFDLAKGIAPDDILVKKLKQAAADWPFSSVGMPVKNTSDLQYILAHPSLRFAYRDRVIAAKDLQKAEDESVKPYVGEALGVYTTALWPEFENVPIKE